MYGLFIGLYQVFEYEYGKYLIVFFVFVMGILVGLIVFCYKFDYYCCFGKWVYVNYGLIKYNYDWELLNLLLWFLFIFICDYNFIIFCLSFFYFK